MCAKMRKKIYFVSEKFVNNYYKYTLNENCKILHETIGTISFRA